MFNRTWRSLSVTEVYQFRPGLRWPVNPRAKCDVSDMVPSMLLAARPDVLRGQFRQAGELCQGHHGHQAAMRHEIPVTERRPGRPGLCDNRTCEVSSRTW